ncbi:hypothetical protein [uncultured Sneathiella sp.]|jgi:hypothetical protein|uniref:hypothetical protein n=1 Tax=uncultured Sneathiella sp. TaxID=879315 RepID=UPI0030DCE3B3|tara:strand:+ start:29334 stop:30149 length:816 start_codon:yes stop_codon:yes gene_type:complete
MLTNAVTNNPYAYLDRDLPNSPVAQYVPAEKLDEAGNKVADEGGFGEDGFGFDDFLDIINPLQHIPGISSLYREITGDELSPGARMIGGTIFGGGIGLAASFINSAIEDATGHDIGGHMLALFSDDDEAAPAEMIAAAPDGDAMAAPAKAEETTPGVMAPTAIAPVMQAPLPEPEAVNEAPRTMTTPIGLEWKGEKPDLLQNVEKAKALQTQELTEEQLHAVFQSFRLATPPEKAIAAQQASSAYQKTADAMENSRPATAGYRQINDNPSP